MQLKVLLTNGSVFTIKNYKGENVTKKQQTSFSILFHYKENNHQHYKYW